MVYINIQKPLTASYSSVNPSGKEQYDQADITYDSSTTFYDGSNPNMYTMVNKPSSTAYTNINKPT